VVGTIGPAAPDRPAAGGNGCRQRVSAGSRPTGRGGRPGQHHGTGKGPGGPGRLPARGSHRPERAQLTHSVPQATPSLYRDLASAVVNPVCAIRQRYGDTSGSSMPPVCGLPMGELLDAPLPSPGSKSVQVPRFPRYYQGAMTSCRPSRRASLPSHRRYHPERSYFARTRPSAAAGGLRELVTRYLQPGIRQWKRQDLLRSWGTPIVLLPCSPTPVGPTHQAIMIRRHGPRYVHGEGSRIAAFEAQSHGFGTGCLRFAGRVAPTPRKTRFRLLAKLFRTGLTTRRVPSKGFKVYPTSILLSQVQRSARTSLILTERAGGDNVASCRERLDRPRRG
jgi:hypothetical protein